VNPPGSSIAADRSRHYAARRLTRRIALQHYENFTVVSLALPRHLRQDFYNIYAFCRHADDLADEIENSADSLAKLAELKRDVHAMYAGALRHPVLIALSDTQQKYDIPIDPFLKLIDAFEQDRRVSRYETFADLRDYCRRSADPVGHLVLYLSGYRDPRRQSLADYTCTALQLTNFWQDVVSDLGRGRIYIPLEDLARFGVSEQDLLDRLATPAFVALMRFQVSRTREWFARGDALLPLVDRRLRLDLSLYGTGGRAILDRIEAVGYNVVSRRPTLSRLAKLGLFARALLGVA
jgi:squalene synthase HpnC